MKLLKNDCHAVHQETHYKHKVLYGKEAKLADENRVGNHGETLETWYEVFKDMMEVRAKSTAEEATPSQKKAFLLFVLELMPSNVSW